METTMKRVKTITIVGGGTAGWMASAYFGNPSDRDSYEVTLIDKTDPERIGVGEATLINFPQFMSNMGFNFNDWMPKVDAYMESWYPFSRMG